MMDSLVVAAELALIAIGLPIAARGLHVEWRGIRMSIRHPDKVLTFFRGFRLSIIGLALVGIGIALMTDQLWLLLLSIAIGIEETIESSIDVFALTRGKDLRLGPASRTTGR
jgi:hypothetical protein